MTLIIDLTKSEEATLATVAAQQGLAPSVWVQNLISENLPTSAKQEHDPMLALFEQWDEEDAGMTSDEIAIEAQQWQAFKDNINAERDRAGARRVF